jgi:hypothetical protein
VAEIWTAEEEARVMAEQIQEHDRRALLSSIDAMLVSDDDNRAFQLHCEEVIRKLMLITFGALVLCSLCWGQEAKPFWTKSTVTLASLDAAAKSADYYFTMRNFSRTQKGFQMAEDNPIARPFVLRGPAVGAVFFAGGWAIDVGAGYLLRKRFPRWKFVPLISGIAQNTDGAIQSGVADTVIHKAKGESR